MIALHELARQGTPDAARFGGKAAWLARLVQLGSPVPKGWAIGVDELAEGVTDGLAAELGALPDGPWAVRSSSTLEDGREASHAGQFDSELAVATADLPAAVARVLASATSERAAAYLSGAAGARMGVVVQRQVEADRSGVVFTLDPATGDEFRLVVEQVEGTGAELMAGLSTPTRRVFDWSGGTEALPDEAREALRLQRLVGHPLDVEFAVRGDQVWIVQARPVTAVRRVESEQWTTANFRDGGVSSRVCPAMMWSLYGDVWETSLRDFLVGCRMVDADAWVPAGRLAYGRPYWNLSQVKRGMARIVGYDEREFDAELGIRPGSTRVRTKPTPANLLRTARIAAAQQRRVRRWTAERDSRLQRWNAEWQARMDALADPARNEAQRIDAWRSLVHDWHLEVQCSYFELIFCNTVTLALAKQQVLRHVTAADWFALVGGLDEVSHLAPARALWPISRQLRPRLAAGEVVPDDELDVLLDPVVQRFGHHGDRELDLSWPSWREDLTPLRRQLLALAALDDDHSPEREHARVEARRTEARERLLASAGAVRGRGLLAVVERMRRAMWWREEFRDLSTRWYHLTRLSTLAVAEVLVDRGVLDHADQVWSLTWQQLDEYLLGARGVDELRADRERQAMVADCFRTFEPPMELGAAPVHELQSAGNLLVQGVGASQSVATGRARVVDDPAELADVRPGDILVTRFTDTGWTTHFASLGGLVTEYGGTLCHAAVVAREYGIACVVAADEATTRIVDGATVRVDGGTGRVELVD